MKKKLDNVKTLLIGEALDALTHLQPHVSLYPSTTFGLVLGGLQYTYNRVKKEYNKPKALPQSLSAKDHSSALHKLSLFKTPTQQNDTTQIIQPTLKP